MTHTEARRFAQNLERLVRVIRAARRDKPSSAAKTGPQAAHALKPAPWRSVLDASSEIWAALSLALR